MTRNYGRPSVFVSIASYRDPELVRTVEDCLNKARHPGNLRFCICWQHGSDEQLPAWFQDDMFSVLDVDWHKSAGVCWARATIMDMWQGEDWYLQLDSHHRFVKDWDVCLLEQAAATGSARPILSTYATPYVPTTEEGPPAQVTRMEFDRFIESGAILTKPGVIPEEPTRRPTRSRFLSAHFLFAPGSFVEEVPYDPGLYFTGEETVLTVRAFTHGYDLFHPGLPILSHEYSRVYRVKHWDDHEAECQAPIPWYQRDATSHDRVRRFLSAPSKGFYGLGTARTFAEYERYAGISFTDRRVQQYTLLHLEPPNPVHSDWHEARHQGA